MFDTDFLLASLFWGAVGTGCLMYGKRQGAAPALAAGLALIALSAFVRPPLLMSLLAALLLAGMAWAIRRGH
jgi:hypothetical protein